MALNSPRVRVLVDWDGDGYVHKGVLPSTPLNKAYFPLTLGPGSGYNLLKPNRVFWFNGTNPHAIDAASNKIQPVYEPTDYGLYAIETTFPLSTRIQCGFVDGGAMGAHHFAPVINGSNTLQFWVRRTSGSGGNFTAYIVDGTTTTTSTTYYGQTTFDAADSWAMVTVSINNTSGSTKNVFLRIDKNSGSGEWQFTGFNVLHASYSTYQLFNVGTTLAAYDNLEPYMLSANWDLGLTSADEQVASEGTLSVQLNNASKTFSVENPVSPFYNGTSAGRVLTNFREGVLVVLEVLNEDDQTWYSFWRGFLKDLDIATAPDPTASLMAEQGIFRFNNVPSVFPVLEDATADTIIKTVANSGWVVSSHPNAAIVSKVAFADATYFDIITSLNVSGIDTGTIVYPYVGEEWQSGTTPAIEIIKDLLLVEQGLFFLARDGSIKFYHRDRIYSDGAAFGSFLSLTDADVNDCAYDYVSAPYNAAKVDYYPKETVIGQIWTSRTAIDVEPYGTVETTAKFEYEEGSKVTVLSINPFSGSNPSTATVKDVSDVSITGTLYDITTSIKNGEAVVTITSYTGAALKFYVTLYGSILVSYGGRSVYVYGLREQKGVGSKTINVSSKLLSNEAMAKDLAGAIVAQYENNYGTFPTFQISSRNTSWLDRINTITIGSRVSLTETNSGVTHKMIVIGENASWSPGILTMDYRTRPADNVRFATLDETANGYMELAY